MFNLCKPYFFQLIIFEFIFNMNVRTLKLTHYPKIFYQCEIKNNWSKSVKIEFQWIILWCTCKFLNIQSIMGSGAIIFLFLFCYKINAIRTIYTIIYVIHLCFLFILFGWGDSCVCILCNDFFEWL